MFTNNLCFLSMYTIDTSINEVSEEEKGDEATT